MQENILKNKKLPEIILSAVRNDLSSFIQKCFYTVNPGVEYLHNWHIDLIAEHLLACERGDIKRLIINVPPRYLKSLCVSVAWPAWLLGHDPSRRIIAASYAQNLSIKHSLDTRLVITSPWYKKAFSNVKITSDQNEKNKFVTTERGMRIATSVGSFITGEGGNYLIVDDPHNVSDIFSDVIRKTTLDWFDQTFTSRLDNKKKGVFVVIMQRLHQNDLSGHLLAKGGWEHLNLPLVAEENTIIDFKGIKKTRETGDFLHEEREGKEQVEQLKKDLGSYAFSAQYQQNPVPIEGGIIKPSWVKRYNIIPENIRIVQSWDTAIKTGNANDYSVCTTWAETENGYFLVDIKRARFEYPDLKRTIINMAEKWNPKAIIVEDKASGQSILQDLRRETKLPLIATTPSKDKITRMASVSALFEAGKVFLPQKAEWLIDYESELFSFPSSNNDDQVDSTSQFLNWARKKPRDTLSIRAV